MKYGIEYWAIKIQLESKLNVANESALCMQNKIGIGIKLLKRKLRFLPLYKRCESCF